jgi:hypothetical protein
MNWGKINIRTIKKLLSQMEKETMSIDGEYSIIYSDGKEQLKISYKRLD